MYKRIKAKVLLAIFKFKRIVDSWMRVRLLDYDKAKLKIHVNNILEYRTRALSCAKEPETVAWLEENIKKDSVLLEIGANIGQYSLIAGHLGALVYACEPAYQNTYTLHRNVSLNGMDEKIKCFPIAFGERTVIGNFTYFDTRSGSSRGFYNEEDVYAAKQENHVVKKTLVFSIDDFLKEFDLRTPTMLKIDVDGGEVEVLLGAKELLKNPVLKTILVEVDLDMHPWDKFSHHLLKNGFMLESEHKRSRNVKNYIFKRS